MQTWFAFEVTTDNAYDLWVDTDAAQAWRKLTEHLLTLQESIIRVTLGKVIAATQEAALDEVRGDRFVNGTRIALAQSSFTEAE